ncbi:MAG TPA: hypothetical protein VN815_09435 [Steroidobacteraceae bacterium]|nr:hypothetical protein [Steroidobacteraceae bacterium]
MRIARSSANIARVTPETEMVPEIRKTGHRMADLAVAFSALFVSLCSLGIALHHGRTMQRLVEANSRPFIQIKISDGRAEHPPSEVLTVTMSNPGAGAARVERFSILVDDKPVSDISAALLQLADLQAKPADLPGTLGPMTYADVVPSYIKAGSDLAVLRWPRTASDAPVWDKVIDVEAKHLKFEACYCSIFDECWIENSHTFRPTPTRSCG